MIHLIPRIGWLIPSTLALALLTGCYHETWSYRAVPNVTISRPHELGSEGPLVLVSLDDAPAPVAPRAEKPNRVDSMTPGEIARFDPQMTKLLDRLAELRSSLDKAQSTYGAQHPKVLDAKKAVEDAKRAIDDQVKEFRATTHKRLAESQAAALTASEPPTPQTVLVGSEQRDWGHYDNSIGRSFVLFIDGPPTVGTYWLNSENSTLILYSAWSAPARTRVGLTGSVKILKVNGDKIEADVAVRQMSEFDTSEFDSRYFDPAYWQTPWIVTGRRTFQITTKEDPALRKAAVQWIAAGHAN